MEGFLTKKACKGGIPFATFAKILLRMYAAVLTNLAQKVSGRPFPWSILLAIAIDPIFVLNYIILLSKSRGMLMLDSMPLAIICKFIRNKFSTSIRFNFLHSSKKYPCPLIVVVNWRHEVRGTTKSCHVHFPQRFTCASSRGAFLYCLPMERVANAAYHS